MKRLSIDQVARWCFPDNSPAGNLGRLRFDTNLRVVEIPFPEKLSRSSPLMTRLIDIVTEKSGFKGCLLWIRETGIWDEFLEEIGQKHLSLLTNSADSNSDSLPGLLFASSERLECEAASILAVVYGGDAYLIPASRDYYVFISHDEFVHVGYRHASEEAVILGWLTHWNAKAIDEDRMKRWTARTSVTSL